MSTFLTKKWDDEMRSNLPKCPACAGEIDYGYLISKDAIHWAGDLNTNKFTEVESPMTGPFKKPLGVAMARCLNCRLMITVFPPE